MVTLAGLLLPGVLRYPETPVVAGPSDADALSAQRATNEALEERVAVLRRVLEYAQCRAPEGLILPEGGLPPMPGLPNGLPSTVAPQTLLPPLPETSVITPPGGAAVAPPASPTSPGVSPSVIPPLAPNSTGQVSLPDLLDASTVMVIALDGDSASTGSAVVINGSQVLTNRHVIEDTIGRPDARLFLTSRALGRMVPATLAAVSPNTNFGEPDLAVLEAREAANLTPLSLSTSVHRMDNVVSAGYPGAVVQLDEQYQRLIRGDASATPELVVTQGMITVIQNADTNPIVGHTAAIHQGNSGGPLVDFCGRVLGINTFMPEGMQTMGYALSASMVKRFLDGAGISATWTDTACTPTQTASAPPSAAAPAPSAPAPSAPPPSAPPPSAPADGGAGAEPPPGATPPTSAPASAPEAQ